MMVKITIIVKNTIMIKNTLSVKSAIWALLAILLLNVALAGCSGLSPAVKNTVLTETPMAENTSGAQPSTLTPAPLPGGARGETPAAPPVEITPPVKDTGTAPQPATLRLWLPPEFDPASGSPAGKLLQSRLDEFSKLEQGVKVEVRTKGLDGPGGLVDSLTTASAAAPLAMPDLVALPYDLLQTAALKGLLHPYDNLSGAMQEDDWYDYARQLGQLQSSYFGLPFAGNALLLVYRPAAIPEPAADWQTALQAAQPLVLPAADPRALFTLAQYMAAGGQVLDSQGRPSLDIEVLTQVLTLFQQAEQAGVLPFWLTQYQSDEEAWQAFLTNEVLLNGVQAENRADQVITWTSRHLGELLADSSAAPLLTADGVPYTLGTGWVWAIASPNPERQKLSARLAEFLSESSFLAEWSESLGLLPARPSAMRAWKNTSLIPVLDQVATSTVPYPSMDVLTSLGAPLQKATVAVLKEQAEPAAAAQAAAQSIAGP